MLIARALAPPILLAYFVVVAVIAVAPAATHAGLACFGDCDGDGTVAVNELVAEINICLGNSPPDVCPAFDPGDGCIGAIIRAVNRALTGCPGLPPLASSIPANGATDVPRTEWIRLQFGAPIEGGAEAMRLLCGDAEQLVTKTVLDGSTLVLNPGGDLPPGPCHVTWAENDVAFSVAAAGAPATVLYDRVDPRRTAPFPDDMLTERDATTATGLRVAVPLPPGADDLEAIYGGLLAETNRLDGFSPVAHFVIELSDPPDPSTLPLTPAASLDPLATVGLFDLTEGAPTYGQRVPFRLTPRTDTNFAGVTTHTLVIFPSIPLTPKGRYGLIITRRVLVDPTRPFDPSGFFRVAQRTQFVVGGIRSRVRKLSGQVISAVADAATPRNLITLQDVALALSITVRSTDTFSDDVLAIKDQILAVPPPPFEVGSVDAQPDDSPLAAIVHGTWQAPDWRSGMPPRYLARDPDGRPIQTGTKAIPFTLALPKAALDGPVPIAMYQHGNPGSSENEVPSAARRSLAAAGFAVIGFTDVLNRELSAGISDENEAITAQVAPVLLGILSNRQVPDFWTETRGEMLAFLHMFDGLGTLDVLPVGAPDGVPDLDPDAARVYLGISEGANNGQGFLPYAPEIRAGALVAGGARLGEVLMHQSTELFLTVLNPLFPSLTPTDLWVGLSLFQTIYDRQDPHNHVHYLYRDRLAVAGTTRKPSVLVLEGLNDTLVPNNATESMAWSMGPIPHIQPVQRPVPFLTTVTAPIMANIDAETTAGFYQYVPSGVADIAVTPGCESQPEGHYCAQTAPASLHQRAVLFQSALSGVPVIIDPFAEPAPLAAAVLDEREPLVR